MLIAVSGSQGCGKSTTLAHLKLLGLNCIERKTSRSILLDWGVTLEEVNSEPSLTKSFQEEILLRKQNDEAEYVNSDEVWFTERTYADLMAYYLAVSGSYNGFSDHLDDYYMKCIKLQSTYSDVFYIKAGFFAPEHDGVRGSNMHYSRMIDAVMLDITRQMTHCSRLTVIDVANIYQRISMITSKVGLHK